MLFMSAQKAKMHFKKSFVYPCTFGKGLSPVDMIEQSQLCQYRAEFSPSSTNFPSRNKKNVAKFIMILFYDLEPFTQLFLPNAG